MYQPAHFVERDPDTLLALMKAHPLATLIRGGTELAADILPLEVDRVGDGWRVTGHVARANALWREADGQPVLLAFQGPQAYVSPNWYPSKAQHGKAVPTWNYATGAGARHGCARSRIGQSLHALVTRQTADGSSRRRPRDAVARRRRAGRLHRRDAARRSSASRSRSRESKASSS